MTTDTWDKIKLGLLIATGVALIAFTIVMAVVRSNEWAVRQMEIVHARVMDRAKTEAVLEILDNTECDYVVVQAPGESQVDFEDRIPAGERGEVLCTVSFY